MTSERKTYAAHAVEWYLMVAGCATVHDMANVLHLSTAEVRHGLKACGAHRRRMGNWPRYCTNGDMMYDNGPGRFTVYRLEPWHIAA